MIVEEVRVSLQLAFEHVAHETVPLWLLHGVNRATSTCEGQEQSSQELFFSNSQT